MPHPTALVRQPWQLAGLPIIRGRCSSLTLSGIFSAEGPPACPPTGICVVARSPPGVPLCVYRSRATCS